MIAKIFSSAISGIDAYIVQVEVDIARGLPAFSTVGLPEGAVRESKDRVKSAIKNSGFEFPSHRITVNLAPADIKKEGSAFDLPIAIGILTATDLISSSLVSDYLILGELSLNGEIKPIRGTLPTALSVKKFGFRGLIVPEANALEASVVEGIEIIPAQTLGQVTEFLKGISPILPLSQNQERTFSNLQSYPFDFNEVKGQEHVKRALEIAAAGGHNIIMVGPPGSGKTMLAQRLPSILPDLTFEEALETSKIYSVMGLMPADQALITTRPFRSPHHTVSDAGLIGGGQFPRPGEVSLAHNGVLFLDELPEFKKNVLEVLRQPLEDGRVTIARAITSLTYPARFMLVAAMNPCPCGFLSDPQRECHCTYPQIQRYKSKISGPLLDRIDLHVEVPSVKFKDLASQSGEESSQTVRERVKAARERQKSRFQSKTIFCNAQMGPRQIKKYSPLDSDSQDLLEKAMDYLGLSARAYHRILKISRTIADLERCRDIGPHHVSEAIQYRNLDRRLL
ncbi:MAG: YifB family Mg chelatase-like AAA ATPase [Pseudomonadota bacterium]